MPRLDSVTSPRPPGAGRTNDWRWPVCNNAMQGGTALTGAVQSRLTGQVGNQMTQAATGTGSSTSWQLRNSRVSLPRLASTALTVVGTGQSWRTLGSFIVPPLLVKGNANVTEWAALRMWAVLGFSAVPSADCDYGVEWMFPANGNSQNIVLNNVPGFGFVRRASGAMAIVRSDGVAVTYTNLAAITPADLNAYEMRIQSATATTDATLSLLVNGREVLAESWGLGLLPNYQATYPTILAGVANFCGAGGLLDVYEFRCTQAPTILETL